MEVKIEGTMEQCLEKLKEWANVNKSIVYVASFVVECPETGSMKYANRYVSFDGKSTRNIFVKFYEIGETGIYTNIR